MNIKNNKAFLVVCSYNGMMNMFNASDFMLIGKFNITHPLPLVWNVGVRMVISYLVLLESAAEDTGEAEVRAEGGVAAEEEVRGADVAEGEGVLGNRELAELFPEEAAKYDMMIASVRIPEECDAEPGGETAPAAVPDQLFAEQEHEAVSVDSEEVGAGVPLAEAEGVIDEG